jgi:S1-C subfamily serine protease
MDAARLKPNKTRSSSYLILVLSTLVMLTVPASTFAQDDDAVAILRQIGKKFAAIAENASPAVVILTADKPVPRGQRGDAEQRIIIDRDRLPAPESGLPVESRPLQPEPPNSRPGSIQIQKFSQKAQGLGFIVSNDGHILTCNHIVKDAKKIKAKLADGRSRQPADPQAGRFRCTRHG